MQRGAPAHLVGERPRQQRGGLLGAVAGEALEDVLHLQGALENRQRVAVDVEVMVGPLLDSPQALQLRQDDCGVSSRSPSRESPRSGSGPPSS
ncbi:MAG: hypothetical protein U0R26_03065 [Solirubrobacterales bacterium]